MKLAVLALVMLLVLIAGCAPTASPPPSGPPSGGTVAPQVRGTFIEGATGGDAETLNWILAADAASFSYSGHTVDSLATYDNNWNVVLRHLAGPVEIAP